MSADEEPRTSCEEYGHLFNTVGAWPSGPDGEWTELLKCQDCGEEYEIDH